MKVDQRIKTFAMNRDRWIEEALHSEVYINHEGEYGFDLSCKDNFDYSTFLLRSALNDKDYIDHFPLTNFDLLSEVFLDTDDPCFWYYTNVILLNRGLSSFEIHLIRIVLSTGLWWNMFWWEWVSFKTEDFYRGWKLNLSILSLPYLFCIAYIYITYQSLIICTLLTLATPILIFVWATSLYLMSNLPSGVTYATKHSTLKL